MVSTPPAESKKRTVGQEMIIRMTTMMNFRATEMNSLLCSHGRLELNPALRTSPPSTADIVTIPKSNDDAMPSDRSNLRKYTENIGNKIIKHITLANTRGILPNIRDTHLLRRGGRRLSDLRRSLMTNRSQFVVERVIDDTVDPLEMIH